MIGGAVHACPYLPGRLAANHYALPFTVDARLYQNLMDAGFRRSGDVFYRPNCPACQACLPIRVPVERFAASRSQRRVRSRNRDVTIEVERCVADDVHWNLFRDYQVEIHGGSMLGEREDFERFLCESPVDTFELRMMIGRRLVGVAIIDETPDALSSVYFYYDPGERRRSLGVLSGLAEIDLCRKMGRRFWYLGYTISGCGKMEYKQSFRPYELLGIDGFWRPGAHLSE